MACPGASRLLKKGSERPFSLDSRLMAVTIINVADWQGLCRLDALQHGSVVEGAYRFDERLRNR